MPPVDIATTPITSLVDLVLGFLLPLVVAVVMRPHWPQWFRPLVTALVCIAAALVKCYAMNVLKAPDILGSVLRVMLMTFVIHRDFWKQTGATGAIEKATSPTPTTIPQKDENP